MKYSDILSFNPIEDVIQLTTARDEDKAREYVKSYVMSDSMAESIKSTVIDQLQMDEVVDNKGVLVVGNYGTGKSHLMSVISSVANDSSNLQYLQNKNFEKYIMPIAGKFEVLRIEIGGVTMSLRQLLLEYIQEDFKKRGIDIEIPDLSTVKDNKKLINDVMIKFAEKYPDKGYLIVIDEFLAFLTTRNEREIVLDLEFFRALGEMCSKSRLRVIFGVQEKIFDNPRFSFVADTLKRVSDRFTQVVITKEDTSFVVSERILKKTPEQKAQIREHLEKFANLYNGMSSRMDDYVNLYPIHPAYIDVFNKLYLIENRHILKNISITIKNIFLDDVPENAPGIISFDNYWEAIKTNGVLKADVTINKVVTVSSQLEEIVKRTFPKPTYKPVAMQIINALSVHRLTTNGLNVKFGLTADNLKDDLCLFLPMPESDADFLLGLIKTTLKDIITTVSGQFIMYNEANSQYYIDVDKTIDYDEKINQKATILDKYELNRYFYDVIYSCLEWDKKEYVTGFKIYEHDLNWESHSMYREGYFFMGNPDERSTAQPERDFYIYIMPLNSSTDAIKNLDDEVYFYFKPTQEFTETLSRYGAAKSLTEMSEGKDKEIYKDKSLIFRKSLIRYLNDNKNTCFDVVYKKERHQLIEVLKGKYRQDSIFNETVDLAASLCLEEYFTDKYPKFPVMQTKVTRNNLREIVRAGVEHYVGSGRQTQHSEKILQSFLLITDGKIKPENSKYAAYYINEIKHLKGQEVINDSDIFEPLRDGFIDKEFNIPRELMLVVLISLVYSNFAVITLRSGNKLSIQNLNEIPRMNVEDMYDFKFLSKPSEVSLTDIKNVFELLDLNPNILDNPNNREEAIGQLLSTTKTLCEDIAKIESKLSTNNFKLWGELLVNDQEHQEMLYACSHIKEEFGNYASKYNTSAKLANFTLIRPIDEITENFNLIKRIDEYLKFKDECSDIVSYIAQIENMKLPESLKTSIDKAKQEIFYAERNSIMDGKQGNVAGQKVRSSLEKIKKEYIDYYFNEHKKRRLGISDAEKKGKIQESSVLNNLSKLSVIDILPETKLAAIEQKMANLKVCYGLTESELKDNPTCNHCRFALGDSSTNVNGVLSSVENELDDLYTNWTIILVNTVSDPLLEEQKQFLSDDQKDVIENLIKTKQLPDKIDDFFITSIKDLLKGFRPVEINLEDFISKLDKMPPCDIKTFKKKVDDIINSYTNGSDDDSTRIILKRKQNEDV